MNVDKLEAGRELDALVEERVMGCLPCDKWRAHYGGFGMAITNQGPLHTNEGCEHDGKCYPAGHPSCFSTRIAAAWEARTKVVDSTGAVMELMDYGGPKDDFERYCCVFVKERPKSAGLTEWGAEGWANTAPLAISRAALKAIQNER